LLTFLLLTFLLLTFLLLPSLLLSLLPLAFLLVPLLLLSLLLVPLLLFSLLLLPLFTLLILLINLPRLCECNRGSCHLRRKSTQGHAKQEYGSFLCPATQDSNYSDHGGQERDAFRHRCRLVSTACIGESRGSFAKRIAAAGRSQSSLDVAVHGKDTRGPCQNT